MCSVVDQALKAAKIKPSEVKSICVCHVSAAHGITAVVKSLLELT